MSGILETNEQKKRNQRKFLEKSVDGLKNKMKTLRKGMNLENTKIMNENDFLIKQINKLRKDLKYLDVERKQIEDTDDKSTRHMSQSKLSDEILRLEAENDSTRHKLKQLDQLRMELENNYKNTQWKR